VPIPLYWSLPFVLLLAAIALMPLVAPHWWERHYPKVAAALALLVAAYYLLVRRDPAPWLAEMKEYVSFVVLLGSLFVVSGGIAITVNSRATPLANVVLLLVGAIVANVLGTTGAAMVLIRPYLRVNGPRVRPYHVVFFIFVVANAGGSLTPIGDPPLFLGYLRGVPFWWVFREMIGLWALVVGLLLVVFFVIDTLNDRKRKDESAEATMGPWLNLTGTHNLLFIAMIVWAVFRPGLFEHGISALRVADVLLSREVIMVAAALASRRLTPPAIYRANDFTFGPIREVAILFAAIFSTMAPALQYLEHHAHHLPIHTPGQYYFATGVLSSLLDNAPTYVTFLKTYQGERTIAALLASPDSSAVVLAISAASVFWGACTYIGNGPNFMVKSIATAAGVETPSFLEYVYKYTLPILLPIYVIVWLVAFR